jgi:hypothetical protein
VSGTGTRTSAAGVSRGSVRHLGPRPGSVPREWPAPRPAKVSGTPHPGTRPGTRARSAQLRCPAPRTRHPAPGTPHPAPAPGTRTPAPGTPHPAPRSSEGVRHPQPAPAAGRHSQPGGTVRHLARPAGVSGTSARGSVRHLGPAPAPRPRVSGTSAPECPAPRPRVSGTSARSVRHLGPARSVRHLGPRPRGSVRHLGPLGPQPAPAGACSSGAMDDHDDLAFDVSP